MINYDSESYKVINGEAFNFTPIDQMMEGQIISEIEALADDFRVPFQMHLEGYKYKEIAENLEIPIGTVKSRVFQARKRLSERIKKN
jgi:RNA polymerase sigma-70 factor (ECF subfamily)